MAEDSSRSGEMKARNVGMSLVRSFSLRVMGSYKTPYSGGFIDTTIMEWGSEKPFSFIFASWTSTVVAFFWTLQVLGPDVLVGKFMYGLRLRAYIVFRVEGDIAL